MIKFANRSLGSAQVQEVTLQRVQVFKCHDTFLPARWHDKHQTKSETRAGKCPYGSVCSPYCHISLIVVFYRRATYTVCEQELLLCKGIDSL